MIDADGIMDRSEYLSGINDFMYQGEVFSEAVLNCYVQLELAGDRTNSLNDVIAQLKYPL